MNVKKSIKNAIITFLFITISFEMLHLGLALMNITNTFMASTEDTYSSLNLTSQNKKHHFFTFDHINQRDTQWAVSKKNLNSANFDPFSNQNFLNNFVISHPKSNNPSFTVYTNKKLTSFPNADGFRSNFIVESLKANLVICPYITTQIICFPPPPPPSIYDWTLKITNTRGNAAWVNLYLDGQWKESVWLNNGQTITRSYIVKKGTHTFNAIVFDYDVHTPIRTTIQKYINYDRVDQINLQDDKGIKGTRFFDIILVETSDFQLSNEEKSQLMANAASIATTLQTLYNQFSASQFTYKVRNIMGWYKSSWDSRSADSDHANFVAAVIQQIDPDYNFYLTDSIVVYYTSTRGVATGYFNIYSTNDGGSGSASYKLGGRAVLPLIFLQNPNPWALAHEFGHVLSLGHPIQYENTNAWNYWSLMGANSAHPNSYYKWALHWFSLNLKNNGEQGIYTLTPASKYSSETSILAYKTANNDPHEFYLIEYRDKEDPYDGENGALEDAIIIYKTTSHAEVRNAMNKNFYDEWLDQITVVAYWWKSQAMSPPYPSYQGDNGFRVTVIWCNEDPILYINQDPGPYIPCPT